MMNPRIVLQTFILIYYFQKLEEAKKVRLEEAKAKAQVCSNLCVYLMLLLLLLLIVPCNSGGAMCYPVSFSSFDVVCVYLCIDLLVFSLSS